MVRILIVEDEEAIRASLIDMLELAGHIVLIASDGDVGLRLAQEEVPDLIISDIMMHNMDGFAMFGAIKENLVTAQIPFIFLTALASYDDIRTGMNIGADDYLTKPFDYKQLTTAVNTRLNKNAVQKQVRLRQFSQRLVEIQERERRILAHELELNIQEPLNGLKMMLNLAQQTLDLKLIKSAYEIAEDVINRSQNLSLQLLPTMIEHLDVISVLVWLFEEYKKHHNFKIDFERAGYTPQCSADEKIVIYRIFEEILNNTRKHGETTKVVIRVSVRENRFIADIRDDGRGFDVQQALNSETTGLQSMFERVTLLDGILNIRSIIGDGTHVMLEFPIAVLTEDTISERKTHTPTIPVTKPISISTIRIIIADACDIVRHGVQQIISLDDSIETVGLATNRNELLQLIQQQEPDIVTLELTIEGARGFDVIKTLRQHAPTLGIIVFSNHRQEIYALETIRSGANGYLLRDSSSLEIITAIHKVAQGEQYISDVLAEKVFEWMLNSHSTTGEFTHTYALLTDREREIMLLVITGLTSGGIAEQLAISPRTVEKHRSNLMSKLGLKTPAQLMKFASEQGLIN